MLRRFLNDSSVICQWSCDMPWSFYDEENVGVIASFITSCHTAQSIQVSSATASWVTTCRARPAAVFIPVAHATAKTGFHGEWLPLPALKVVAQIRALAESDDPLDTVPEKLPLETVMNAILWADLEQTATWNRKIAICLRNSGHTVNAIGYFERALEIDNDFVEARGGLATAYGEQGYFSVTLKLCTSLASIHPIYPRRSFGERRLICTLHYCSVLPDQLRPHRLP